MTSPALVALLDRPGSDDLCMLGFVTADSIGRLRICGVANRDLRPLTHGDLAALIEDGHALPVDGVSIDGDESPDLAVGWIGEGLLDKIRALDAPLPPFLPTDPDAHRHDAGRGWFVVRPTKDVYEALVRWTRAILLATVKTGQAEIARLALRALPDSDDARAALWLTSPLQRRAVQLEWFARLDQDAGRPRRSPAEMERDIHGLLQSLVVPGGSP